ncbi:PQQ-dependent sugar dehydrogenase [Methanocella arvoryzae]|uniref:L-sorbosone dehydrogenase n=1 Tax=Methanocella arvoryzae (strain DSM 22066 / NBRC 105507 / MRE50) TaxID=351160 RepID=Q0W8F9_METAR|nr:putative L-sorbosone dehydrogenase [Methanocella arvoryzae MRE50]
MLIVVLALLLAGFLLVAGCLNNGQATVDIGSRLSQIQLPPGFAIEVYADDVPNARQMALGANGTVYVGTRTEGKVYAIQDTDRDGHADKVYTIAEGLHMPNGVAYRNGSLYLAEVSRILRFDDIDSKLDSPPEPVVVYDAYPGDEWHGWKYIAFGPDSKLYVPVGAPCNICDPAEPYAAMTRMNPDGTGFEIYARGIRNTVGFDWDDNGTLWFTDNGRDWMGNTVPPDELNSAPRKGMHFGYPYVHGTSIMDPEYGKGHNASEYTLPVLELDAHTAALGMKFYRGDMFPAEYKGNIFIAEHGSWNRDTPVGYRITLVSFEDGKAADWTVFAEGWLQGDKAWGRPVDVLVMPDGSMLVSDDAAGAIYRITYEK